MRTEGKITPTKATAREACRLLTDIAASWRLFVLYVAVAVLALALTPMVLAEWLSVEGRNGS